MPTYLLMTNFKLPLNIELQKAETRVMTYVGRMEMFDVMKDWDKLSSPHFYNSTCGTINMGWACARCVGTN